MSDELMQLDEIKKQYEQERAQEVPVVHFADKPEQAPPPSVAQATMQAVVGQAVVHQMSNDNTRQRVLKTADKVIHTEISKIENQAEQGEKEAVFANNKDACDLYGIDEKTVPKWVVQIAKIVQNFWYLVWLLVGSFTTAPVVFLGKKIKVVIKRTWLAMLLAILIYAAVFFAPIVANLIKLQ